MAILIVQYYLYHTVELCTYNSIYLSPGSKETTPVCSMLGKNVMHVIFSNLFIEAITAALARAAGLEDKEVKHFVESSDHSP